MTGLVAQASVVIDAPREAVWKVLTTSGTHPEIMMGAEIVSDWTVGSPILWRGEWKGTTFEDHGEIVELDAPDRLVVTHFSPMTGQPDVPENYHRVSYSLSDASGSTRIDLEQDNNSDDEARQHASENWATILEGVKAVAERAS